VFETNFKKRNYVKIPTCTTYATNHPDRKAHAGSAVMIRKDITYQELAKYETDHIQIRNTGIEEWDGSLTISVIVGGDFNVKHLYWGFHLISPKGQELYQTIQIMQIEIISTGEPIHWPADVNKTPVLLRLLYL
jgi:hypothetical protein